MDIEFPAIRRNEEWGKSTCNYRVRAEHSSSCHVTVTRDFTILPNLPFIAHAPTVLRPDMCDLLENLLDIPPLTYFWKASEHPMVFAAFWGSREKPVETPPKENPRLGKYQCGQTGEEDLPLRM